MKALLFIAAALSTAPSFAQSANTPLGSRIARGPNSGVQAVDKARQISAGFAECVVNKSATAARSFVLVDPTVDPKHRGGQNLLDKVSDGDCLLQASEWMGSVKLQLPGDTLRYVLADALFRRELAAQAPMTDLKLVPGLSQSVFNAADYQPEPGKKMKPWQLAEMAFARDKESARVLLAKFGECVVRVDPAASHALLRSSAMTSEENAAFKALVGGLGACLPEGKTIELGKASVRGTLAYNYYRLANAPRTALVQTSASAGK